MQSCGLHTSLQERTGWHSWLPASRGIQPFHLYVHFTGTFLCFGPSKTRRQESVENWGGRVESSGTGTWRVSVKMQSLQHQGKTAGLHGYFVERKKAEGWRPEWGVITDLNEMEVRKKDRHFCPRRKIFDIYLTILIPPQFPYPISLSSFCFPPGSSDQRGGGMIQVCVWTLIWIGANTNL